MGWQWAVVGGWPVKREDQGTVDGMGGGRTGPPGRGRVVVSGGGRNGKLGVLFPDLLLLHLFYHFFFFSFIALCCIQSCILMLTSGVIKGAQDQRYSVLAHKYLPSLTDMVALPEPACAHQACRCKSGADQEAADQFWV